MTNEEFTPAPRDIENATKIAAALTEAMNGIGRCWVTVEMAIVESPVEWRANVALSIEPLLPAESAAKALGELGESLAVMIKRAKEKLRG